MWAVLKEHRKTWAVWGLYLLVICILMILNDDQRTVTPSYIEGAQHWLQGLNLYNSFGNDFIYFPQSAILYIPLALLPFPISEIIWRLLSLCLYAYSVERFSKLAPPQLQKYAFPILSIAAIALAFASIRNGQMNVIMAGLLLLAVVATQNQSWWRSAFFLTLSLALKPTAIVWWLLMMAFYPPLRWRLFAGLVILLAFPFLTQHPQYVLAQYHDCFNMLHSAANLGTEQTSWAQLFGFFGTFGLPVSSTWQYLLRIFAAVFVLGCTWFAKRNYTPEQAAFYLYTFAACYLMLFNPRTENNDYIILAPGIGMMLVYLWHNPRNSFARSLQIALLIVIILGILGSYTLGEWLTPGHHAWLSPLMTLIFSIMLIYSLVTANLFGKSKAHETHHLMRG